MLYNILVGIAVACFIVLGIINIAHGDVTVGVAIILVGIANALFLV